MSPEDLDSRLAAMELSRFTEKTLTDPERLRGDLDLVRSRGYATNLGERETEMGAVAVPVVTPSGEMVLSISVFGLYSRFDAELVERAIEGLKAAASQLGQSLAKNG